MTSRSLAITRNNTSTGSFGAQTWDVGFPNDVTFTSFVCDIFAADTYQLKVDGVSVATVVATAGQTGVTFTPSPSLALSGGVHTFSLVGTASRRFYYTSGAINPPSGDPAYGCWGPWVESNTNTVPGTLNFNDTSGQVTAGMTRDTRSASSFVSSSWNITFDQDVQFDRFVCIVADGDTYQLAVDGNIVVTGVVVSDQRGLNLQPTSPLALATGTHSFKVTPLGSRKWNYRATSSLIGSSHVTAWGGWAEAATGFPAGLIGFTATAPGATVLTGTWGLVS